MRNRLGYKLVYNDSSLFIKIWFDIVNYSEKNCLGISQVRQDVWVNVDIFAIVATAFNPKLRNFDTTFLVWQYLKKVFSN